jgi:hypothetical protein
MNTLQRCLFALVCLLIACSAVVQAGSSRPALWIEVKDEHGELTTIAVTREIAAAMLEADKDGSMHLNKHGHSELITKQMLRDVLDGTRETVHATDPDNGSEVTLYMKDIDLPGHAGTGGSVVLETYKNGERTFRMKLGEMEFEAGGKDDNNVTIGWKGLLPFLSRVGGAVYVNNDTDGSEVWLFMD